MMEEELIALISVLNKNESPSSAVFLAFLESLDFTVDKDFIDFIQSFNGAEGFIGKSDYLILWEIDDLMSLNPYYIDNKECEGLYFIGSNGSNFGYAFDKSTGKIVGIDFLEISEVQPELISNTFISFLRVLSEKG
jgi:hypothetical protein